MKIAARTLLTCFILIYDVPASQTHRSHTNRSQGLRPLSPFSLPPISDTIFRFTEVRDVTNREDVSQAATSEAQHTRRGLDDA